LVPKTVKANKKNSFDVSFGEGLGGVGGRTDTLLGKRFRLGQLSGPKKEGEGATANGGWVTSAGSRGIKTRYGKKGKKETDLTKTWETKGRTKQCCDSSRIKKKVMMKKEK